MDEGDLYQNEILSEGKKTTLLVEVFNEEVPGQVFTVESMSIVDQNDCESDEGLFCIEEVESLGVNVELECNDFYGEISNLEGIFVISPSDAVDKKNDVICPVNLSGFVSGSDRLEGNECLFKTLEFLPEGSLPTYKLQPGKYVFSFFVWGTLLWSEEFQFVAPSDDIFEEELYEILVQCLEKQDTRLSDEAEPVIWEYIRNLCANRELSFANARTMKNLSRAIFEMMILRMSKDAAPESERVVLADDVESFVWKRLPGKIGFSCGV